ncbi:hypothetical protein K5X82_03650 [Halosquirtibacter xylanolyticus]|uniref:S41 family peptidase n=1 Tax=Halosquirtibacter xylanolyticus TaxID=3374599 RepID=UPI003747C135|nr:hypothetical protein K5X82_03650 [Prolixibacteraceae bacterium]
MQLLKYTISTLLVSLSLIAHSQKIEPRNKYVKDFTYLIDKLKETHIDPYGGFGGKEEFKIETLKAYSMLTNNITLDEFTTITNQFLSHLEDGHTHINSKSQRLSSTLPIKLESAFDHIFISKSDKKHQSYIGHYILKINGIKIEQWLDKVHKYRPAENIYGDRLHLIEIIENENLSKTFFGCNKTISLTLCNANHVLKKHKFHYGCGFHIIERTSCLDITLNNNLIQTGIINPRNPTGYFKWNSMVSREVIQHAYNRSPKTIENYLSWAYNIMKTRRNGDINIDMNNIPSLYDNFCHLLEQMKQCKSKNLIIDLSENRGGMTPLIRPLLYLLYGDHYLKYHFNAKMCRKISPLYLRKIGCNSIQSYNQSHHQHYQLGEIVCDNFGSFDPSTPLKERRQQVLKGYHEIGKNILTNAKVNKGVHIYVITSPRTFSAAFHFMYFMKRLGRTTIVGVPSSQSPNAFMESTPFCLPNTELKGTISNSQQILYPMKSDKVKVLHPDIPIDWDHYRRYSFSTDTPISKIIDIINTKRTSN